ncbi:hypothetical protein Syn7803US13_53 [Synechococcus phage ACG-2014f]|jgi:hypothetical protein|uniref:Uncharacterized protein n=3 Tax=Atlauavirus TaxID=2733092 RepID=A0A0E3I5U2_9CAUD|nr:hypothetical protein HOQ62_gp054 [Synechococcus phage ACG-2014f_Syn7803C8]YP_009778780.1 hypothetical protein HOQ63_gp053 [Synechococcus phage ACG-2014f_Syn7803US26]AIX27413.1 hypothetical protein Syn7803US13_53 [Synechococcus phage ACG-2014f]AIX21378.1 hypothetical protein Syn7803C8_54 [Synechococcus phage ACG-2014f_Syn7803C8]AIX28906.1 hypothetical protein Syn7803US26_53 [Synechococcus phage ACG-2014f_Syn7803US26]AIX29449.1 hypothetical protein Syn7803US30_53 [Synechococcus phage ACG-2014
MKSVMSGVYGALIGTASAIVVFAGLEFFFPTQDTYTVDLNKRETTSLKMSVIRTPCGYDYCFIPAIKEGEAIEIETHNPNPEPGFLRPVESTDY